MSDDSTLKFVTRVSSIDNYLAGNKGNLTAFDRLYSASTTETRINSDSGVGTSSLQSL